MARTTLPQGFTMKKYIIFVLHVAFVSFYAGCAKINDKILQDSLSSQNWKIQYFNIDGTTFSNQKGALITFDSLQHRIYGNTGCNNYGANFTLTQNKISISKKTSTRKICDEEVMEYELPFLENLEDTFEIMDFKDYSKLGILHTIPQALQEKKKEKILVFFTPSKVYFLTHH